MAHSLTTTYPTVATSALQSTSKALNELWRLSSISSKTVTVVFKKTNMELPEIMLRNQIISYREITQFL